MKKIILAGTLAFAIGFSACEQKSSEGTEQSSNTMDNSLDSLSYSFGISIGNNLKQNEIEELNPDMVAKGIADVYSDAPAAMSMEESQGIIQAYYETKANQKGAANSEKGKAFLSENSQKEGVQTTQSGLQYEVLSEGDGNMPKITDKVTVHYRGTLIDGTVFDSSYERGEPASFPVNGVIPGWIEALQMMPVGSKWKLYIPSELAYGERGAGRMIGPNETLIFEVELLSIDE